MSLKCQHCGERILSRSFGKCPGCLKELPEEFKLTPAQLESIARAEKAEANRVLDEALGIDAESLLKFNRSRGSGSLDWF